MYAQFIALVSLSTVALLGCSVDDLDSPLGKPSEIVAPSRAADAHKEEGTASTDDGDEANPNDGLQRPESTNDSDGLEDPPIDVDPNSEVDPDAEDPAVAAAEQMPIVPAGQSSTTASTSTTSSGNNTASTGGDPNAALSAANAAARECGAYFGASNAPYAGIHSTRSSVQVGDKFFLNAHGFVARLSRNGAPTLRLDDSAGAGPTILLSSPTVTIYSDPYGGGYCALAGSGEITVTAQVTFSNTGDLAGDPIPALVTAIHKVTVVDPYAGVGTEAEKSARLTAARDRCLTQSATTLLNSVTAMRHDVNVSTLGKGRVMRITLEKTHSDGSRTSGQSSITPGGALLVQTAVFADGTVDYCNAGADPRYPAVSPDRSIRIVPSQPPPGFASRYLNVAYEP